MKRKIAIISLIVLLLSTGYLYRNRKATSVTTDVYFDLNKHQEGSEKREVKSIKKEETIKTPTKSIQKPQVKETKGESKPQKTPLTPSNNHKKAEKTAENPSTNFEETTKKPEVVHKVEENTLNQYILNEINALRGGQSLSALSMNGTLVSIANIRSQEISQLWSHTRPDGTRGVDMVDSSKHRGENLSKAVVDTEMSESALAKRIVNNWVNSPSHYKIMMMNDFTQIGIETYCVQDADVMIYYTASLYSN